MVDKQKLDKNFGQLKTLYNGVLVESISTGDKKRKGIFKHYIKVLKENESLKTQFYIFNNIENKIESDKDKAVEFVKENISLMGKFSKEEITNSYPKLVKPIIQNSELGYDYSNEDLKELHENISFLVNTEKNGKTVGDIIEATHKVADYIINNKKPEPVFEGLGDTVLSNNDLSKLMVSKFNKEYSKSLSESEVLLLKNILISNSDDTKKNEMFKESINECLSLVNDKLKISDVDLKMSLLDLKENLLDKKYNNNSFEVDILKLNTLKESLK